MEENNQTSSQETKSGGLPKSLLIAVVVLVVGGVGYFALSQSQKPPQPQTTTQPTPTTAEATATPSPQPSPKEGTKAAVMEKIGVKVFDVSGKNFAFSVKEIRVKRGDKVKINFTSSQGSHNWVIDEFNAKTATVSAGEKTQVEFTADKKGTFEYYCNIGSHRKMGVVGNLIVE